MKIAEFEKKVGLSRDTLRYYEKIGVLTAPRRDDNGYRNYGQSQIDELAFIEKGKAIGFTLTAIRDGYKRYIATGKFCPDFTQQLIEKKILFSKRIVEDKLTIKLIDKMLS